MRRPSPFHPANPRKMAPKSQSELPARDTITVNSCITIDWITWPGLTLQSAE
jgi:hypothetical protein